MSKICTSCNTKNVDEAKFCRKCGSSISDIIKEDIFDDTEPLVSVEEIESEWDKKYAKLQQEVRNDRKLMENEQDNTNKINISNNESDIKKTYTKLDIFFYPNNYTEEEKKKILGDEYEEI